MPDEKAVPPAVADIFKDLLAKHPQDYVDALTALNTDQEAASDAEKTLAASWVVTKNLGEVANDYASIIEKQTLERSGLDDLPVPDSFKEAGINTRDIVQFSWDNYDAPKDEATKLFAADLKRAKALEEKVAKGEVPAWFGNSCVDKGRGFKK